jgi:hypothetical protein
MPPNRPVELTAAGIGSKKTLAGRRGSAADRYAVQCDPLVWLNADKELSDGLPDKRQKPDLALCL